MKAVVLAGGEGTRLKPLTSRRPKPLIPIAGRPCIDFVIRSLIASGFREIVITTSYLSDRLIRSIGDGVDYNASILYSFEGTPAGTAGAVRRVANFIGETFVVAMGDVVADVDFRALYEFHRERGGAATIALTRVTDPTQYGIAAVDQRGRIVKFREKPRREEAFSDLANAGIYVLEPKVLEFIPPDQPFDFAKDVFPRLLAKGLPVYGKELDGVWMDIGRPRDLWRASMEIVKREGKPLTIHGVTTDGPLIVQEGAVVEAGATLHGPVFLGAGARIRTGCSVSNACIYEGTTVDRDASITNSIVLEQSRIGARSEVMDSVVARNCTIEEDVRLVLSLIGDDMTVKAHSRLENATVSPPPE
jgi:NDP-sugar pyrophosphorylase family protein